jgi:hypothetical protein
MNCAAKTGKQKQDMKFRVIPGALFATATRPDADRLLAAG